MFDLSFNELNIGLLSLPIFFLTYLIFMKLRTNNLKTLKMFFFLHSSRAHRLGAIFFFLALLALSIALMDPRGHPRKVSTDLASQKTIIIVDSSSSMLVEDVRPNRFQKALLIARHFVRNAFGHRVAIVVFSDTQKRLVPFTDDIDFLEARISAMEDLDIQKGGSNISQAIRESLQYFKADSGTVKKPEGNLLILSDSEGHEFDEKLDIPDGISVAFVGVGTSKGGPIPLRYRKGSFKGYKKFKGEKVISKLDESYIKKLKEKIQNYKYWIVRSYNIPTEEILNFFKKNFLKSKERGQFLVKPVKARVFILGFIVFYLLSLILSRSPYKRLNLMIVLFVFMVGFPHESYTQEEPPETAEERVYRKYEKDIKKMKEGKLRRDQKLKLAEKVLRENAFELSELLYKENTKDIHTLDSKVIFNYGTSLLAKGKIKEATRVFSEMKKKPGVSSKMKADMADNILLALKSEKKKKKEKEQNKNEKNKKDKNKKNEKSGKDGEPKKKKKPTGNKNEKEKEKSSKPQKGEKQKKKEKKPVTPEEKARQKRKMMKIPSMVKQILQQDRTLQKKNMKTTKKKFKLQDVKDW